jgi:hypothetical protein
VFVTFFLTQQNTKYPSFNIFKKNKMNFGNIRQKQQQQQQQQNKHELVCPDGPTPRGALEDEYIQNLLQKGQCVNLILTPLEAAELAPDNQILVCECALTCIRNRPPTTDARLPSSLVLLKIFNLNAENFSLKQEFVVKLADPNEVVKEDKVYLQVVGMGCGHGDELDIVKYDQMVKLTQLPGCKNLFF